MKCVKYNNKIYKYKITMGDIEAYQSLSHQEEGDWAQILGLPADIKIDYPTDLLPIDDYRRMCADCGLTDRYYDMEPAQIIDAYEGHKRTMYDLGNLIIVAIRKSYDSNAEPFQDTQMYDRASTFEVFKEELENGSF